MRNFFRPLSYYRYTFGVSFFMIFKLKSLFQKLTKNDDNNFRRKFVPFLIDPRHKKNTTWIQHVSEINSILLWFESLNKIQIRDLNRNTIHLSSERCWIQVVFFFVIAVIKYTPNFLLKLLSSFFERAILSWKSWKAKDQIYSHNKNVFLESPEPKKKIYHNFHFF